MKKVHVFNAGPCLLPQVAIDNAMRPSRISKAQVSLFSASPTAQRNGTRLWTSAAHSGESF